MDQQLINHSPDLKCLQDEGFEMEMVGGHLLVHHLPYVNSNKIIKLGTLVCSLTLETPTRIGKPTDHTAYLIGETPCLADGMPYIGIINHSNRTCLAENLWGDHFFSSKPPCGFYENYYEKVWTYAEILCAQARVLDPSVTYQPNKKKEVIL